MASASQAKGIYGAFASVLGTKSQQTPGTNPTTERISVAKQELDKAEKIPIPTPPAAVPLADIIEKLHEASVNLMGRVGKEPKCGANTQRELRQAKIDRAASTLALAVAQDEMDRLKKQASDEATKARLAAETADVHRRASADKNFTISGFAEKEKEYKTRIASLEAAEKRQMASFLEGGQVAAAGAASAGAASSVMPSLSEKIGTRAEDLTKAGIPGITGESTYEDVANALNTLDQTSVGYNPTDIARVLEITETTNPKELASSLRSKLSKRGGARRRRTAHRARRQKKQTRRVRFLRA
jgi:hypothetical protein